MGKGQKIVDKVYARMAKDQDQLQRGIGLMEQERKEILSEQYRLGEIAGGLKNATTEAQESLEAVQASLPKRLVK